MLTSSSVMLMFWGVAIEYNEQSRENIEIGSFCYIGCWSHQSQFEGAKKSDAFVSRNIYSL